MYLVFQAEIGLESHLKTLRTDLNKMNELLSNKRRNLYQISNQPGQKLTAQKLIVGATLHKSERRLSPAF